VQELDESSLIGREVSLPVCLSLPVSLTVNESRELIDPPVDLIFSHSLFTQLFCSHHPCCVPHIAVHALTVLCASPCCVPHRAVCLISLCMPSACCAQATLRTELSGLTDSIVAHKRAVSAQELTVNTWELIRELLASVDRCNINICLFCMRSLCAASLGMGIPDSILSVAIGRLM
jgi:hypothetical protein